MLYKTRSLLLCLLLFCCSYNNHYHHYGGVNGYLTIPSTININNNHRIIIKSTTSTTTTTTTTTTTALFGYSSNRYQSSVSISFSSNQRRRGKSRSIFKTKSSLSLSSSSSSSSEDDSNENEDDSNDNKDDDDIINTMKTKIAEQIKKQQQQSTAAEEKEEETTTTTTTTTTSSSAAVVSDSSSADDSSSSSDPDFNMDEFIDKALKEAIDEAKEMTPDELKGMYDGEDSILNDKEIMKGINDILESKSKQLLDEIEVFRQEQKLDIKKKAKEISLQNTEITNIITEEQKERMNNAKTQIDIYMKRKEEEELNVIKATKQLQDAKEEMKKINDPLSNLRDANIIAKSSIVGGVLFGVRAVSEIIKFLFLSTPIDQTSHGLAALIQVGISLLCFVIFYFTMPK